MILTPLDIRQKTFEKKFRGYDQLEVEAFLKILSTEWENIVEEKKILEIKLDTEKTELKRLQKIEHTLFKTLQTAEETGKTIIQQANREADITLKEKKNEANQLLKETKMRANRFIENAEISARTIVNKTTNHLNDLHKELLNLSTEYNKILVNLEQTVGSVQKSIDENKKKLELNSIDAVLENSRSLLNDILSQIDYLPINSNIDFDKNTVEVTDKNQIIDDINLTDEDASLENKHIENEENKYIHQIEWKGKEVELPKTTPSEEQQTQLEKEEEYQDEKKSDDVSFFDKV